MKASNIYQTLKSRAKASSTAKPQLPGIGSPLKKSPYKTDPPKAKAKAAPPKAKPAPPQTKPELTPNEVKYAKYGFKSNIVPEESRSFSPATNELTRNISPENQEKYGVGASSTTNAKVKSPANMKSPVKMDSCASEATVGSNPKRAMRQAKRQAKKGHRKAKKDFRQCKRSRYGRGNG